MPRSPKRPAKPNEPYTGRWVARLHGRVVGQGGTPRQALLAAKAARSKESPQVEFMPNAVTYSLPPILDRIRAALPARQEIYLVGGAVRDLLQGRPIHDFDFVLSGNAISLARKAAKALGADFYPLDEKRGAGRILLEDEGKRLTLDFIDMQGKDIDADLAVRDLTINAMAIDLRQPDALLDPTGGAADLLAKQVRGTSPNAFHSDPVRVLRAVRMAAGLGMRIEKETRQQMRAAAKDIQNVSTERLRDEFFRLLQTPKLAASLRALEIMGALDPWLPDLTGLKKVEQSPPHVFDVWDHSVNVIEKLETIVGVLGEHYAPQGASDLHSGLVVLRLGRFRAQISQLMATELVPDRPRRSLLLFAALFHDVGKSSTRSVEEGGRIRFIKHETRGAEILVAKASAFHLSNAEIALLETIVKHHGRPFLLTQTGELPSRRAIYRFFRDTGDMGVDICLLSLADFMGKYGVEIPQDDLVAHLETLRTLLEAYFEQADQVVAPPALLNGDELMSELLLTPGPKVGEILEAIREAQAVGEVISRVEALALAKRML